MTFAEMMKVCLLSHDPSSDIPDLIEKHFSSAPAAVYEGLSRMLTKEGGGTTFPAVSKMVKYLEKQNILRTWSGCCFAGGQLCYIQKEG